MKNKIKTIIITIILLYFISFFAARLISGGLEEKIVSEGIAVIPIVGTISIEVGDGFFSSGISANSIVDKLEKANKNKGIKAIILDINSGGGGVVASREVVKAVKEVKKPVIALIREVGASGAYWIASSADWIIADEMSITGSIGVFSGYLEFSGLLENYNVSYERLIAGEYKDMGVPYRQLTDQEKIMMQQKLNLIHDYFIKDVAKNRNLSEIKVRELANGFFYLGVEGKDVGLVDELGGKKEAIAKAKELGNLKNGNLIEYKEKKSIFDFFGKIQNKAFYYMGRGIGVGLFEKENKFEIIA